MKLCELGGIDLPGVVASDGDPEAKPKLQATVAPAARAQARARRQDRPLVGSQGVALSLNVEIPASWTEEEIRDRLATVRRAMGESNE